MLQPRRAMMAAGLMVAVPRKAVPRKAVPLAAFVLAAVCILAACAPSAPAAAPVPSSTAAGAALPTAPMASAPTSTALPLPTASPAPPTPTPTLSPLLCSPLAEIDQVNIPGMVTNPYNPPDPGYDDPHTGIDIADRMPGSQAALAGRPVQAALGGRVAMVVHDRFPFGNALVIETPLESAPEEWWSAATLPTPSPTLAPRSALTCPADLSTGQVAAAPAGAGRSLYILYAHLQSAPEWKPGDTVACGEVIGAVGGSGNALNPHLHFETRVGPSGVQMHGMAHYDASARPEEMAAYCLWSVSGLFQLVDPRAVLALPGAP